LLKVNWLAALVVLVPAGVVTVILAVPFPFRETAVIDVAEFTVNVVALVEPRPRSEARRHPRFS
jgi:hypothetical protein